MSLHRKPQIIGLTQANCRRGKRTPGRMNHLSGDTLVCTPGSSPYVQPSWQFREAAIGSLNAGIIWKHIHQSPSIHLAVTTCPELCPVGHRRESSLSGWGLWLTQNWQWTRSLKWDSSSSKNAGTQRKVTQVVIKGLLKTQTNLVQILVPLGKLFYPSELHFFYMRIMSACIMGLINPLFTNYFPY